MFKIINSSIPSRKASYIWVGWRANDWPGKTTPQALSVGVPNNSAFIKLAMRPKNNPIGAIKAIKSLLL